MFNYYPTCCPLVRFSHIGSASIEDAAPDFELMCMYIEINTKFSVALGTRETPT